MGKSKRDVENWDRVLKSYRFNSESEALSYDKNPIDILKPLAIAKVPILHVAGSLESMA